MEEGDVLTERAGFPWALRLAGVEAGSRIGAAALGRGL